MHPLALFALAFAGWLLLSGKAASSSPRPVQSSSLPSSQSRSFIFCSTIPIVGVSHCAPLIKPSVPLNPNLHASCEVTPNVFAPDQVHCTTAKRIAAAVSLGPNCSQQLAANLASFSGSSFGGPNPSGGTSGANFCDGEFCKMFK